MSALVDKSPLHLGSLSFCLSGKKSFRVLSGFSRSLFSPPFFFQVSRQVSANIFLIRVVVSILPVYAFPHDSFSLTPLWRPSPGPRNSSLLGNCCFCACHSLHLLPQLPFFSVSPAVGQPGPCGAFDFFRFHFVFFPQRSCPTSVSLPSPSRTSAALPPLE